MLDWVGGLAGGFAGMQEAGTRLVSRAEPGLKGDERRDDKVRPDPGLRFPEKAIREKDKGMGSTMEEKKRSAGHQGRKTERGKTECSGVREEFPGVG